MANPEHVEMLVNSTKDQWNAWRKANPHQIVDISGQPIGIMRKNRGRTTDGCLADFRGFDFRRVDLTHTSFHESDLTCADLRNRIYTNVMFPSTKMHKVKLNRSVMRDCVFTWSDLTSADLTDAKFPDSHLKGVILSDATLHNTDFSTTDLTSAIFSGCDLRRTRFIGANLTCSLLQFSNKISDVPPEVLAQNLVDNGFALSPEFAATIIQVIKDKVKKGQALGPPEIEMAKHFVPVNASRNRILMDIKSISDLFTIIGNTIQSYEERVHSTRFRVYYRGHACKRWSLESSLYHHGLHAREHELLRELTQVEPDEFRDVESTLDRLVLARHHSLPARLLDVTRNPLVALYFACQAKASCSGQKDHKNCARDGQVHMLVTPAEMIKAYDSDTVSVVAALSHLRQVEQDVLLTSCPDGRLDIEAMRYHFHDAHMRPSYFDVMQRLVHFVARDKPYFRNAIDPRDVFRVLVVEPRRAFTRVRAQSGAFLLSGFHRRFEAEEVKANGPEIPIYDHYTIGIPKDAKPGIMKQLGYAQITDETMLPGLEPVARYIGERYGTRNAE